MRHTLPLLALAAAANAATFTLNTSFDNSYLNDYSIVGTGTFSYDAPSALADGNYSWTSFTNASVYISFSYPGAVFTQGDFTMDPVATGLGVEIKGGLFHFTTVGPDVAPFFGAAEFENGIGLILSTSPNAPGQLGAFYVFGEVYGGTYGIPSTPVPEPSTYGLALGGLALAVVAARRRAKRA